MKRLNFALGKSIKSASKDYYKIIQLLGEGKSATAYLALKTSSIDAGTFCVVKVMQHPADPVKASNFDSERDFLKQLRHTSIVSVRGEGSFTANYAAYPFYICDFYSRNLTHTISTTEVKITQKLSYAIQMCSALSYLAANNIIHCDIKPDNIYSDGLKCVLADFGLARKVGDTGEVLDFPSLHRYRSPDIVEAKNNKVSLTPKSDVFQLGLVLAELFTGRNPCLPAENGGSKVFIDDIQPVYGKFGSSINKIIDEMLQFDKSKRPDANQLIDRWQTVLFNAYDYILEIDKNVF